VHFAIDAALLDGFVLALVRATAWVFVTPPFSTRGIPWRVRAGVAVALALAAAAEVDARLPNDVGGLAVALVLQAFTGFALGFIVYLLVSAIQAAGGLIDDASGFNLAAMLDPLSEINASVFARFYQLLAIVLLFVTDLHLVLVRGFMRSFAAVPAVRISDLARLVTEELGVFLVSAIEIAGPVIAVLFLTEIAFGILARAAPAMNVFVLAFPVRIVVALLGVSIALPLVAPALERLVADALRGGLGL
jgi:flagellar biosynthetic protein FliR